jgi:hypothetical protein
MGECTYPNCRKWTLVSAISKKRRSGSPSNFTGARCFLPPPDRVAAADRYSAGRIYLCTVRSSSKRRLFMPDIIAHTADIDDQIAVARENLRADRAGGRLLRCCRR